VAIQTLVVSALDNYFNWGANCLWQLVDFTYSVAHHPLGDLDWSLVAILFGLSASDVKTDG
jgi:hypothetical protein